LFYKYKIFIFKNW